MGRLLADNDLKGYLSEMKKVFLHIPYQLDDATEKRYHGLFHAMSILACSPRALVVAEASHALGRADLIIDMPNICYLFEFKRDASVQEALDQIEEKKYTTPWEERTLEDGSVKPVQRVAVVFSTEKRNIVNWVVESGRV